MLPSISDLQFVILEAVRAGELAGREIRRALGREGYSKTRAAFYQLMERLEKAKLIKSRTARREIDGHLVYEKYYRILASGRREHDRKLGFYAARLTTGSGLASDPA